MLMDFLLPKKTVASIISKIFRLEFLMRYLLIAFALLISACSTMPVANDRPTSQIQLQKPSVQRLSDADIATVKKMLSGLEPYILSRQKAGTQALLTFEELYSRLDPEETRLVSFVEGLKPDQLGLKTPWMGYGDPATPMVQVRESYRGPGGVMVDIPAQYLPAAADEKYRAMMSAMQSDLGRRLYLSSGHRSGAYQIYLYFFYLKNHDWSIKETGRFVALPGYSEHGAKHRQALDFVAEGVALEDESEKFENLPEYSWLQKNASRYGFVLSYPKNSPTGITFEPWHWHFEAQKR